MKDEYRLERRYNWTMDILAWGHGRYTQEELDGLTMPELRELHSKVYLERVGEINAIRW